MSALYVGENWSRMCDECCGADAADQAPTRHVDAGGAMSLRYGAPKTIWSFDKGALRVILGEPVQCTCGAMVTFLVNRSGKTRCVECDELYQAQQTNWLSYL